MYQEWTDLVHAHDQLMTTYRETVTHVENLNSQAEQARGEFKRKEAEFGTVRSSLQSRIGELESRLANAREELEAYRRRRAVRLANRLLQPRGLTAALAVGIAWRGVDR
jgi:predicted RNase H-like nuclease (RuvC/YqgF family)